jgi:hypothetical protein
LNSYSVDDLFGLSLREVAGDNRGCVTTKAMIAKTAIRDIDRIPNRTGGTGSYRKYRLTADITFAEGRVGSC